MAAISVTLDDQQAARLEQMARRLGVTVEALILVSIDDFLAQPDETFLNAPERVVQKNAELYRRLA